MINIIVADHEPIFRAGAARVLAVEDDLRIVGQPQTAVQLLNTVERLHAHVLLISDQFVPALLEKQRQPSDPGPAVVVVAENEDTAASFVPKGARGIVYRSIDPITLVQAVRRIAAGGTFIHTPNSTSKEIHDDIVGARVADRLSDFELRIIGLVMHCHKNRQIAEYLNTNEHVVKNAMRSIFDKIGVSDRLELALFVFHHRMLAHALPELKISTSKTLNAPIKATVPIPVLPAIIPSRVGSSRFAAGERPRFVRSI